MGPQFLSAQRRQGLRGLHRAAHGAGEDRVDLLGRQPAGDALGLLETFQAERRIGCRLAPFGQAVADEYEFHRSRHLLGGDLPYGLPR